MKKNLIKKLFLLSCLLLPQVFVWASEGLPINKHSFLPLAQYIQILEDKKDIASVEDIQINQGQFFFSKAEQFKTALELGHSDSSWWLKIVLQNEDENSIKRVLEVANSHLSYVTFYQQTNDGKYKQTATGNLRPFETRPKLTRHFAFPIEIEGRSSATYYIKIKSETQLLIPINLWEIEAYNKHERNDYSFQFFYLGIVIAMAFFSLFYFWAVSDRLYLKYLAFLISATFTVYALNGLVKEYIPYDTVGWAKNSAAFAAAISVALLLNFMRHFLSVSQVSTLADKVIKYAALVYPIPMVVVSLYPYQYLIMAGKLFTISIIVSIMVFSIYLCWKKQRMAYFFVVAYSIPFVVLFINLLSAIKYIPQVWDVAGSTQVSFLIEMMVFSMALVDRTSQMKKQNEMDQMKIISLQNQVVEALRLNENKLETIIAKRYKELRHLIDMLTHEIRTPMSIIRMFIEMGSQNPSLKRNAISAISDIDDVIERCIETDQLDHGSIVVNLESCDVTSIVTDVCDLRPESARIKVNSNTVTHVATDQMLLHRIISNLLDNALKYSPAESLISVDIVNQALDGIDGVHIIIKNDHDAAGLPDEQRVFEKYYRSYGAHAKTGSGLGLYLVQSFAKLLSGKISYRVENQQIVFDLWIPR
jgi:signal transduction histidine kinase